MQMRIVWFVAELAWLLAGSADGQSQLMAPEKRAALRANFPLTEDPQWQQLADDPTTLYYTDDEIPPAYQHADAGLLASGRFVQPTTASRSTSFHSPKYNISGGLPDMNYPHGMGGNGNIEFPWRTPGGTDGAEGSTTTYRMMWLPKQDNGKPWPVVWYRGDVPAVIEGPHLAWKWVFPHGTIFSEVLALADSRKQLHVYEVRIRIRRDDHWDVEILRPFPTAKSLANRLEQLGHDELAKQVDQPRTLKLASLTDTQKNSAMVSRVHKAVGFAGQAAHDYLPEIPERLAMELLDSTPFVIATGARWRDTDNDKVAAFAPTTHQTASIVPKDYAGTFLGTDTVSCKRCHESTLMDVRMFDRNREWYGRIRGNDAIFTFHPIDPASISYNGGHVPVRIRQEFVESGMVAAFDEAQHRADRYTVLPESELKP